jgi:hypothetical protein
MKESARHVRLHDIIPVLAGHFNYWGVDDARRIIHQKVELAKVFQRQSDSFFGAAVFRHVRHERDDTWAGKVIDRRVDVFGDDFGTACMQ